MWWGVEDTGRMALLKQRALCRSLGALPCSPQGSEYARDDSADWMMPLALRRCPHSAQFTAEGEHICLAFVNLSCSCSEPAYRTTKQHSHRVETYRICRLAG